MSTSATNLVGTSVSQPIVIEDDADQAMQVSSSGSGQQSSPSGSALPPQVVNVQCQNLDAPVLQLPIDLSCFYFSVSAQLDGQTSQEAIELAAADFMALEPNRRAMQATFNQFSIRQVCSELTRILPFATEKDLKGPKMVLWRVYYDHLFNSPTKVHLDQACDAMPQLAVVTKEGVLLGQIVDAEKLVKRTMRFASNDVSLNAMYMTNMRRMLGVLDASKNLFFFREPETCTRIMDLAQRRKGEDAKYKQVLRHFPAHVAALNKLLPLTPRLQAAAQALNQLIFALQQKTAALQQSQDSAPHVPKEMSDFLTFRGAALYRGAYFLLRGMISQAARALDQNPNSDPVLTQVLNKHIPGSTIGRVPTRGFVPLTASARDELLTEPRVCDILDAYCNGMSFDDFVMSMVTKMPLDDVNRRLAESDNLVKPNDPEVVLAKATCAEQLFRAYLQSRNARSFQDLRNWS